jgi:hypothetical protein
MGDERRRTPRFPFVASAEYIEATADAKLSATVSELSLYGCYLDTINPLPMGRSVTVKIYADGGFFEAQATVAYSHPNLGMGLTFRDVKPYFMSTLQKWILLAMHKREV